MGLSKIKQAVAEAAAAVSDDFTNDSEASVEHILDFFKIKRDGEGNYKDVTIKQTGFISLLMRLGFRRYDRNDGTFCIVRLTDNIIEEISIQNLRLHIFRYLQSLPEDVLIDEGCPKSELIEKYVRSMSSLLSEEKLSIIIEEAQTFNLMTDTKDCAYYFYRNGFVQVKKGEGITLRPYAELPGTIWKDQILPRDFVLLSDEEMSKGMFYRFCCNIADNRPVNNQPSTTIHGSNPERFVSLMTITGYNLHSYYEAALKATILLDARTSDEADGRSGKSLWCKALRQVLNRDQDNSPLCVILDGKSFDPDNRFKYEQLNHNTRLAVLDDVVKGLKLDIFFNAIVDGFLVERKGSTKRERIRTKLIITLNYTLNIRGGSAKDRAIEFEFADYYSSKFKPESEFGCWFFRDWDRVEWERFDSFMMASVDYYMNAGLIQASTLNLETRKLKDETCTEFIQYMEELGIEHEKQYDKRSLYAKFVDLNDDGIPRNKDLAWCKLRGFTEMLKRWAEYRPEYTGYKMNRSNGKDYIRFFYNAPISDENKEGAVIFTDKSFAPVTEQVETLPKEKLPF